MPDESVSQRVAQLRRLRGLTQQQLADLVGVSLSLVRRVEQGQVPATPAFIGAVARALKSSPAELQGQPFRGVTAESDRAHAAIGPLRAEVVMSGIPDDGIAPRPAAELQARVAAASQLAHRVQLVRLGDDLPGPQSALAAARGAGDFGTADAHLAEATRAAGHLADDDDHYRMTVNRTNVAIWAVGLAVELGDGTQAVRRAATMHGFAGVTPNRASHHYIDLARAHLYAGDRTAALDALLSARKLAPQQTRYHPQVRETVRMLARLERRRTDSLAAFTSWLGI